MKYRVVIIPKDRKYEDVYDTTTYFFESLQKVTEFFEIIMTASNDSICQIEKLDGDING